MLTFIDVSNHQGREGMDLSSVLPSVDGVICKATEGTGFVDKYCDGFVQACRRAGKLWGFYHFNGLDSAKSEAAYFLNNTVNYFGEGIPILDWEYIVLDGGDTYLQPVSWVNEFVRVIHDQTGIWPWIYGNPWCFEQGDVEQNCGRWAAHYFSDNIRTFAQAEAHERPKVNGLMCAWQFTPCGRLEGYSGNLDLDLFFGDEDAWHRYAAGDAAGNSDSGNGSSLGVSTLENENYKVTIERKMA